MSVKIKDIPGVMIKSKQIRYENNERIMDLETGEITGESSNIFYDKEAEAFNQALSQQGEVKIGLSREKLIHILLNIKTEDRITGSIADIIISKLPELLESVYTCSVCNSNPCQSTCSKQQFPMERSET